METLKAESLGQSKVSDGKISVTSEPFVSTTEGMANPETKGQSHRKSPKQHVARNGVSFVLWQECKKTHCFLHEDELSDFPIFFFFPFVLIVGCQISLACSHEAESGGRQK